MNLDGEVEVQLHTFLTLVLNGVPDHIHILYTMPPGNKPLLSTECKDG
jgi:REP element-mobilizing transposase RayT